MGYDARLSPAIASGLPDGWAGLRKVTCLSAASSPFAGAETRDEERQRGPESRRGYVRLASI